MFQFQSLLKLDQYDLIVNTIRDPLVPTFVFDLLLQQLIKEKRPVLLVLMSQNFHHYSAISMKCGFNLKNYIDNGLLKVMDSFDYDPEKLPDQFLKEVISNCSSLPQKSFVLFDDIQVFNTLELSPKNFYISLRKIKNLLSQRQGCLFVGSTFVPNDDKWTFLINNLLYECDVWLDCDNPKTGYSHQIQGIMKCHYQHECSSTELSFRISDRNVLFTKL